MVFPSKLSLWRKPSNIDTVIIMNALVSPADSQFSEYVNCRGTGEGGEDKERDSSFAGSLLLTALRLTKCDSSWMAQSGQLRLSPHPHPRYHNRMKHFKRKQMFKTKQQTHAQNTPQCLLCF